MKVYLSRRYRISASHRLHSEAYDEQRNQSVYGKCNNPHGHGHNYVIEVTVSGHVDAGTGMICNLGDLDGFMQREIVERFDQTNLNLDAHFQNVVPTTENLCIAVYDLISAGFDRAALTSVRIEETANNSFKYCGKQATSSKRPDDRYA